MRLLRGAHSWQTIPSNDGSDWYYCAVPTSSIAHVCISGAPFEHYVFDDVDIAAKIKNGKLWEDLLQFDAAGYLISASTHWKDEIANFMRSGSGKLDKSRPTGLQKNHAYTVLTVSNIMP